VIVIGNAGDDAARALAHCRPEQIVVDVTRSALSSVHRARAAYESKMIVSAGAASPREIRE